MSILRAYKTELDLNNIQKTACARHAGAVRWANNWGLARKLEAYQNGEKVPTSIDLHRELNVLKEGELSWMYEVFKCAHQEALRNLDQAYAHFFRRVKKKKAVRKIQAGFPKFKSKKHTGWIPADGCHSYLRACHPTASPGVPASERAWLSTGGGCPHLERHGE
jgi:putative transposase